MAYMKIPPMTARTVNHVSSCTNTFARARERVRVCACKRARVRMCACACAIGILPGESVV